MPATELPWDYSMIVETNSERLSLSQKLFLVSLIFPHWKNAESLDGWSWKKAGDHLVHVPYSKQGQLQHIAHGHL